MEMNVDSAKKMLANPSPDLQSLLDRAAPEAKNAMAEAKASLVNGASTNAHTGTSDASATEQRQIIDESKNFSKDLSKQIDQWGLGSAGFDYNIVAVFGSQSTGKSTLLNRLFGTTFDVMDETRRQQTTKGIWMCKAQGMNVMVMDVEGTDGRERGEDQDFERKAALFSLASSEVLIVNLWEHQVGLYQGANMGLLKTVFEVNLGLFGKKGKDGSHQRTMLLFVIRDFIGATPLANLSQTLFQDISKIWEGISKPEGLENAKLTDYFDLQFTGLPHKVLVPEKFENEVAQLRRRFVDKSREDYVLRTEYHKRIPADGVAHYMEGIWEQVQTNKDLDLPTQQELLAQFRCDEIATVALEEFIAQAKAHRKPVEAGKVVEGLGALMAGWVSTALARFDRDASRYHQGVYSRKRADLIAAIDSALSPLFLGQLKNLHKRSLLTFKRELTEALKGESYNFGEVVTTGRSKCEETFVQGAKEALLKNTDWSYDDELELLREEIGIVADQCRADETKKMVNQIERNFKRQISEPVEVSLYRASPQMWDDVLGVFTSTLDKSEATYLAKAMSFNCTDEENTAAVSSLQRRAWQALRVKVDELTADSALLGKLRSHFEDRFRYDKTGVPRVWKPDDDIDGAFRAARDETLELIPLYSKISPKEAGLLPDFSKWAVSNSDEVDVDYDESLVVLPETKILDLSNRFRREADAFYVEAKRSTVSSIAQIPVWMYAVLVVLGWNEAMVVLFNPLYFTMLLVGLAATYITFQLGLVGPLMQVTRTVGYEVQRQASNRLREHFSQPQMEAPVAASNSSRIKREEPDSYSLKDIQSHESQIQ